MKINKIYNEKTVDKHFKKMHNLEKKAIFYEKIIGNLMEKLVLF